MVYESFLKMEKIFSKNKGSTLIEIIIVMAIIAIFAGMSYDNWARSRRHAQVEAAANEVSSLVNETRNRTLIGEKSYCPSGNCSVPACFLLIFRENGEYSVVAKETSCVDGTNYFIKSGSVGSNVALSGYTYGGADGDNYFLYEVPSGDVYNGNSYGDVTVKSNNDTNIEKRVEVSPYRAVTSNFSSTTSIPTCSSFTYSDWSPVTCPASQTQTRTVTDSSPSGCTGGSPITSQTCVYTAPAQTCTSFTYSDWEPAECPESRAQTRTVTASSPEGCTGGTPVTSKTCTYIPVCTTISYSAWSPDPCPSSGVQTRYVTGGSPGGCKAPDGSLTQTCTPDPTCNPACTGGKTCTANNTCTCPSGAPNDCKGNCTDKKCDEESCILDSECYGKNCCRSNAGDLRGVCSSKKCNFSLCSNYNECRSGFCCSALDVSTSSTSTSGGYCSATACALRNYSIGTPLLDEKCANGNICGSGYVRAENYCGMDRGSSCKFNGECCSNMCFQDRLGSWKCN